MIGSSRRGAAGPPPQQHDFAPVATRSAAWPYRSRTVVLMSSVLIWPSSKMVDVLCQKRGRSTAAAPALRCRRSGGHGLDQLGHFSQGIGVERVVHPATFATVGDQTGLLQHLQVERQPRLGGVERVREVADAPFTQAQALEDRSRVRSDRAWNNSAARGRSVWVRVAMSSNISRTVDQSRADIQSQAGPENRALDSYTSLQVQTNLETTCLTHSRGSHE